MTLFTTTTNFATASETEGPREKTIFGWVEYVELKDHHLKVKAKLDTGAKTSSIHAKNIEWFTKQGEDWVRFEFIADTSFKDKGQHHEKAVTIEAPVERSALIKQHKRTSVKRAVVRLPFALAGVEHEAEFTLTDRGKFLYPVLLGRRFLKGVALVDPSNTFLRTSSHNNNKDAKEETE